MKGEVASWSGQLGSYVEDVKCYTIVEQRIKLILSWVRSVSLPLTLFQTALKFAFAFLPLAWSLKV